MGSMFPPPGSNPTLLARKCVKAHTYDVTNLKFFLLQDVAKVGNAGSSVVKYEILQGNETCLKEYFQKWKCHCT